MSMIAAVIGRILLALIFIMSGLQKVVDPSSAATMLESTSLPANWATPTGIFEVVAGLMLALGILSRFVSIVLFGFVGLTIFFFHNQFGDPLQGIYDGVDEAAPWVRWSQLVGTADSTCSLTLGRTSEASITAPRRLAVAMACSPATPAPRIRMRAAFTVPAAVISIGMKRG